MDMFIELWDLCENFINDHKIVGYYKRPNDDM